MDFLDLPDRPGLHKFHRCLVRLVRVNLDAHLGHQILAVGELGQLPDFVDVMGQRLLAVDGDAQLKRGHALRRMHMVRGANADRIDMFVLFIEHAPPVFMNLRVVELAFDLLEHGRIHLGDVHHLHAGVSRKHPQRDEGHIAGAKAGQPHGVARRSGNQILDEERRCCCGRSCLRERGEESPAIRSERFLHTNDRTAGQLPLESAAEQQVLGQFLV